VLAHRRRCDSDCAITRTGALKHGRPWQGANNRRLRSLWQRHSGGLRQLAVGRRGRTSLGKARRPALLLGDVLEEEGGSLQRCTHHLAGGRDKEARNSMAPAARGPRRPGAATFHCGWALQTGRLFFLAVARVSGDAYRVLEMDSLGLRYSGSGDIGCWFVDFRGPKYRGS
jgi:hypothetical protein